MEPASAATEFEIARERATPPPDEAIGAAKAAHLHYVNDLLSGITRDRSRQGFAYRGLDGKIITDEAELTRIKSIAVPPAWTRVWICPDPNGHILATGRDARGRKQYRYHPRWRAVRDETKFEHILDFGRVLPEIRRRVDADLALPGLPREKVLAAVVRLMERTLARIGNPEYARDNNSFGLTTLKNRHVRITRGKIELDFRAKHAIRHHSVVSDRKLARILKNCRDLPGAELFQYLDDDEQRHSITSSDVNNYLREISGHEITAKDFPHLGRDQSRRHRILQFACGGPTHQKIRTDCHQTRRRTTGKHTRDLPQVLHPSGSFQRLPHRSTARESIEPRTGSRSARSVGPRAQRD